MGVRQTERQALHARLGALSTVELTALCDSADHTPLAREVARALLAERSAAASELPCVDHPGTPVSGSCSRCGRFICIDCDPYLARNGRGSCGDCDRRTRPARPVGIRGWLLIPAFQLLYVPVMGLTDTISRSKVLLGPLTRPAPALIAQAALEFGLAGFGVFVATRFFRRKADSPRWMTAWYLGWLVPNAVLLLASADTTLFGPRGLVLQVSSSLLGSMIWIAYFALSTRVKATFTEP